MATASQMSSKEVREYYDKTLGRFAGWISHQDTKAAFALVILGVASADLFDQAARLADAHDRASGWGDVATIAFWLAVLTGALTVLFVWLTVVPRVKPASGRSVFFFGTVASYPTVPDYRGAVGKMTDAEIEEDLAEQVWELARHAATKAKYARLAYMAVFAFLVFWGAARVALSLAS